MVVQVNGIVSRNILDLDASNYTKFSRHLIVTLPGEFVFRDNQQVFKFVRHMCNIIKTTDSGNRFNDSISSSEIAALRRLIYRKYIHTGVTRRVLIIDLTVYTSGHNRNFRIVLSVNFEDIGRRHFNLQSSSEKRARRLSCFLHVSNASLVCYPALIKKEQSQFLQLQQSSKIPVLKPIQN